MESHDLFTLTITRQRSSKTFSLLFHCYYCYQINGRPPSPSDGVGLIWDITFVIQNSLIGSIQSPFPFNSGLLVHSTLRIPFFVAMMMMGCIWPLIIIVHLCRYLFPDHWSTLERWSDHFSLIPWQWPVNPVIFLGDQQPAAVAQTETRTDPFQTGLVSRKLRGVLLLDQFGMGIQSVRKWSLTRRLALVN